MASNSKSYLFLIVLTTIATELFSQAQFKKDLAHTYSVVLRDKNTGEMAVGVQSHWFAVGTRVSWGKSGVGAIATQSFTNPAYGPDGLKLLSQGKSATEVLEIITKGDEGIDFRQVAVIDANGNVAAHTGKKCIKSAGHLIGDNYSVQANMMLNDLVVPAMAKSLEQSINLPIAERVVQALLAAQDAGGDIRGKQSAALIVMGSKKTEKPWLDKTIDLRVDDHAEPLKELQRLLTVHQAFVYMNEGDAAIETGDMAKGLEQYEAAAKMLPDNLEMKYWRAVTLANNDRLDEALVIFKEVFGKDENWRELTKRLPASDLLNLSDKDLDTIIKL